ncbi:MAG TPA: polysaccharide deacetylase family protein [Cyclobacteriaceae bacterium]|nr:polysaccharide deacetylase family protein [Cyclobacteriaceae bacterium]
METKVKILTLYFLTLATVSYSQSSEWKGKSCAVVLTYDDALNVHLDNVIPALDSLGLKGTFYLSAYFPGSKNRIADWRKAALHGHELGNHTLFHPCLGKPTGRSWVSAEQTLENYSMTRLLNEIRMTNVFLEAIDGKTKRTFAYPCGDMTIGDSSYVDKIKKDFVAARGVKSEMLTTRTIDYYNVGAFSVNGQTGQQLIEIVKEAMKKNALVVFLFHGVGGEHGLNVELKAHRQLVHFLKEHEKEIWTTTFLDATEHMNKK